MDLSSLDAISPIDGRYRKITEKLADYFSEASLIRYRIKVEAAYYVALCHIPLPQLKQVNPKALEALKLLAGDQSTVNVKSVKEIEAVTNHDVKAVEYFIKQTYEQQLGHSAEFIHFGLTSQDINNTAVPLSIKDAMSEVIIPAVTELRNKLVTFTEEWRNISILAHTHGQPASPTALGKEIAVFVNRVDSQLELLKSIPWSAKFGG